jgi:hypothetical protein
MPQLAHSLTTIATVPRVSSQPPRRPEPARRRTQRPFRKHGDDSPSRGPARAALCPHLARGSSCERAASGIDSLALALRASDGTNDGGHAGLGARGTVKESCGMTN